MLRTLRTNDPLRDVTVYDEEEQAWLSERPVCEECGEPISEDHAYYVDGEWYCIDCFNSQFLFNVDDWVDRQRDREEY